ncbi:MAG: metallophosphoesterase family protein [Clostridiales bacterium]|nr:metallophosphoesterase family protein [Clostridiales bacterium]
MPDASWKKDTSSVMRYAVLSDVHGNCPALKKVLADADRRGIGNFIIAGDYALSGAWPDECIQVLLDLPDKLIIRGNEERYLEDLIGKDQSKWTDGQMQISYWCYRNIAPEHLSYVLGLPVTDQCGINGVKISMAHSSDAFIGEYEFGRFGPAILAERYNGSEVTKERLGSDIKEILDNDPLFAERVNDLEDGVYIFGHSHVQWSYKVNGRNIWLINPGSCGLPLDGIRDSIPYSVLTIASDGEISLEEVRIPFDKKAYAEELMKTMQYKEANVWSKVIIHELLTAREHLTFFLQFADRYADGIGDPVRPFTVNTWEAAYEAWESSLRELE